MKKISSYLKQLQNERFHLQIIAISLSLLHLVLAWKLTHGELKSNRLLPSDILSYEVPFWGIIVLLTWKNIHYYFYNKSIWQTFLALFFLSLVLIRTITLNWLDVDFFILSPFLIVICLALLAVDLKAIKSYWWYLLCLCFMAVPANSSAISSWLHIAESTTAISAFLLNCLGMNVVYHDNILILPTAKVTVSYFCAGGPLIIILLKVSILLIIAFPLNSTRKLGLVLSAVGVGFGLGCVRVAFLVIVVHDYNAFHYWHGSHGSSIFLSFGVIIFVLLSNLLIPTKKSLPQTTITPPNIPTRWRFLILFTTHIGIVFAIGYLLYIPSPTRRILSVVSQKLDNFSIDGWQQITVKSLPLLRSDDLLGFEGILGSRNYKYSRDFQQLDVTVYYIVNTGMNQMNVWAEQLTTGQLQDNFGDYILTNDHLQAHLFRCINSRGETIITWNDRNNYDITIDRLTAWLLNKDLLSDQYYACIKLSTPLNATENKQAYQLLKSVWYSNYKTWHKQLYSTKNTI